MKEAHHDKLRRLTRELRLARERERKLIARELHDNIGQNLAFMRMKLVSLRGDAVFSGFDKNVDEILTLLDQTIRRTRTLSFEISPPVLHELGLPAAIEWLAEKFEHQHKLTVRLVERSSFPRLNESDNELLFACVRELLVNVVKHAETDTADVILESDGKELAVTVADTGRGFDPGDEPGLPDDDRGFGLFNIREQLDCCGGSMFCRSAPGKGCRVTLTLPVRSVS